MTDLLPEWPLLSVFCVASLILAITPGPGVIYIVTRSVSQGRRAGMASVIGVAIGNLGNAFAAAIGLGALLATSSTIFSIVKYAGAFYLIYLGIRTFYRRRAIDRSPPQVATSPRIFLDGLMVALLNPKTAIFFAAFLPQFMSVHSSSVAQSISLGTLFVMTAAVTDTVYALGASVVAPRLSRMKTIGSYGRFFTGGALVGLGVFAALSDSRNIK